ncbi:MAG: hypothetical protein NZ741_08445, partial [Armatimonadetes bacterium]|nr:hypothetical protein [Armatimonadota bacterium]
RSVASAGVRRSVTLHHALEGEAPAEPSGSHGRDGARSSKLAAGRDGARPSRESLEGCALSHPQAYGGA